MTRRPGCLESGRRWSVGMVRQQRAFPLRASHARRHSDLATRPGLPLRSWHGCGVSIAGRSPGGSHRSVDGLALRQPQIDREPAQVGWQASTWQQTVFTPGGQSRNEPSYPVFVVGGLSLQPRSQLSNACFVTPFQRTNHKHGWCQSAIKKRLKGPPATLAG